MDIIEKRITKRHLSESELSGVNYYNCIFERIQLDNFNFRDCEFEKCRFVNCSIKNLKLNFFKLIDCEFKDCLLQGVNAADIMFPCTFSLVNCDLRFVDFISLRLQKSIFYPVASVIVYLRKQTFVNLILLVRSLIIQSSDILICLTVIFQ
ncbi:hypothetical protein AI2963V1_4820 (plasmid) [Escherichia coli]|nr:hypothetical protein AI2963V1_4820 [Escherichia coli]CAH5594351.1 hypothetical protein AI2978V1_4827 [Escherichia coli]